MITVSDPRSGHKNVFEVVARPFLQDEGLPFAKVLTAELIQRVFHEEHALFGQNDLFSTQLVLWAFLSQTLRDGKGAACSAAVAEITTYLSQMGQRPPSGDTGDYCRARAKLNLRALRRLVVESARHVENAAEPSWLWNGLHPKLVDGFTFTMLDTPQNQEEFPQSSSQRPGVGFPIARACTIMSLATAGVCDVAIGPYQGKQTGETALLRDMLNSFEPGDVALFDRYYCSFMMLALLALAGVQVCTRLRQGKARLRRGDARLHQGRTSDFRRGRRLGPGDHLITWTRPARPTWMSPEQYTRIPPTLTLRELRFEVMVPGRRTRVLTLVTTLTDAEAYSREDLAELYGFRWNVELDIRAVKQTLGLDHVRCKTPGMVRRQLWVTLLAYNLIRQLIATAAAVHDKTPRQLGFTLACQTVLASWMLWSTGSCSNSAALYATMLAHIAANEVANRPGRIEPRVLKRRRHGYPLMQRPRDLLRRELGKT